MEERNVDKPRASILKRLLSFALATVLSVSSLTALSNPIQVQAGIISEDNATGGGSSSSGSNNRGGATSANWGYRIYVIDENRQIISPIVDVVSQKPTANKVLRSTRFGGETSKIITDPMKGMPAPFKGSFTGNGLALKNWLINTPGSQEGFLKIDDLIINYFGRGVYEVFRDQSTKKWLAFEPITWHNLYRNDNSTSQMSQRIYGTANNWLEAYSAYGIGGGTYTSKLDHKVLQQCLMLERDQPELGLVKPHSGIPVYSNGNEGWGLQLYSNDGLGGYHTWDSKHYTGATYKPAKSPDPNEAKEYMGTYTVIKNYRSIGEDGVTLKDDDTEFYIRKLVNSKIKVEDEELYRVIGWKTSNITAQSKLDSTKWETTVPGLIVQQGVKRGDVELDKNKGETTLYVLLQREDVGTHTWDEEHHPDEPEKAP